MLRVLSEYENEKQVGENFIDCERGRDPESIDKVCRFNVDQLGGSCTWQKDYGYDEGQPCVIIKLNRVSRLSLVSNYLIIRGRKSWKL